MPAGAIKPLLAPGLGQNELLVISAASY